MSPLVDALTGLPCGARRLAIAYSGGHDSSALLHAAVSALGAYRVRAIHVCHHLQPQATRWADHCARQARVLGVAFTLLDVVVDRGEQGMEAGARRARYRALSEALMPGDMLATAHHAEDQAETFLIQALRGAGVAGLAGMPVLSRLGGYWLWRPWLQISRDAIRAYAQTHALTVVDDPTNQDESIDRGYIRRQLWPALTQRWPAAGQTLARSAGWAAQAAEAVQALAAVDLAACAGPDQTLQIEPIRALSSARQTEVIRRWLEEAAADCPDHRHLEQILGLLDARADSGPRVSFGQTQVHRFDRRLFAMPRLPQVPVGPIRWQPDQALSLPQGNGVLTACGVAHAGELTVGFRQGGEVLLRADGRKMLLKDWFSQRRVPPWLRERAPLIYSGDKLVAVADYWVHPDFSADLNSPSGRFVWQHDWPRG